MPAISSANLTLFNQSILLVDIFSTNGPGSGLAAAKGQDQ